jgi:hypothetical protein
MRTTDAAVNSATRLASEGTKWFKREAFKRLPNSVKWALGFPLGLILLGIVVEGVFGFYTKLYVILPGLLYLFFLLLGIGLRRAPLGVLMGWAFSGGRDRDALGQIFTGYTKFIAAIISSEMVIGVIALILPAYQSPALSLLLLLISATLFIYYLWKGTGEWWAPFVAVALWVTGAVCLLGLLAPGLLAGSSAAIGNLKGGMELGFQNSRFFFIFLTMALMIAATAYSFTKEKRGVMWLTALILVSSWWLHGYYQERVIPLQPGKAHAASRLVCPSAWPPMLSSRTVSEAYLKRMPEEDALSLMDEEDFTGLLRRTPDHCEVIYRVGSKAPRWTGNFGLPYKHRWRVLPNMHKYRLRITNAHDHGFEGDAFEETVGGISRVRMTIFRERASGGDWKDVTPYTRDIPDARFVSFRTHGGIVHELRTKPRA